MSTSNIELLIDLILEMKKDQDQLKEIAIKNTAVLEEHARRSTASEGRLELQEAKLEAFMRKMEPVEDHVKFVNKSMKLVAGLITVAGVIMGIIEAIRHL